MDRIILIKRNSKKPVDEIYKQRALTYVEVEEAKAKRLNLARVIGENHVVININRRNGGVDSYKRFKKDHLNNAIYYNTITPDGYHVYLSIQRDMNLVTYELRKTVEGYPGLEFLRGRNSYVLIPPSVVGGKSYIKKTERIRALPRLTYKFLRVKKSRQEVTTFFKPNINLVSNHLNKINPDVSYNIWIKIGLALYSYNKGDKGLELWDSWSSRGSKYKVDECRRKWLTFNDEYVINIGYIFSMSTKEIKYSKDIVQIIRDERKTGFKFENLENTLQVEKTINEGKTDISKALMFSRGITKKESLEVIKTMIMKSKRILPEFLKNFYFYENLTYYNIKTQDLVSTSTINGAYTGKLHELGLTKKKASDYLMTFDIKKIDSFEFQPTIKQTFFEKDGKLIGNSFKINSFPKYQKNYKPKPGYENAIQRLENHIRMLTNDRKYYFDTLLYWISHQRQNPGILLRWAPLLVSIQGIGKTYIEELLKVILGPNNVKQLNPKEYRLNYNSWADSKCLVVVFNEVNIKGKDAADTMEVLKAPITDLRISITRKYKDEYQIENRTNYIFMSNNNEAVVLSKGDRRFWVVKNELRSVVDLKDKIETNTNVYFDNLFDDLIEYKQELINYFENVKISDEFRSLRRRPESIYSDSLAESEYQSVEGFEEAEALLKENHNLYNKDYILTKPFFSKLEENLDTKFSAYKRVKLMNSLGFSLLSKIAKFNIDKIQILTTPVYVSNLDKTKFKDIKLRLENENN